MILGTDLGEREGGEGGRVVGLAWPGSEVRGPLFPLLITRVGRTPQTLAAISLLCDLGQIPSPLWA